MTDNSCWLVCSVELKFSAPSSVAASLSYPTLHQIINSGIAAELSGLFLIIIIMFQSIFYKGTRQSRKM